jgi:hypothetical protein
VAFENIQMTQSQEVDDFVALQLDRFVYQILHIYDDISISEIAELIIRGSTKSDREIAELLSMYLGFGHRDDTVEDYLAEVV